MTKEITELQDWLSDHPTDFTGHIKLKRLIKEYGEALDKYQNEELNKL